MKTWMLVVGMAAMVVGCAAGSDEDQKPEDAVPTGKTTNSIVVPGGNVAAEKQAPADIRLHIGVAQATFDDDRDSRPAEQSLQPRRRFLRRVLMLKLVHSLSNRCADDNGGFIASRQSWL